MEGLIQVIRYHHSDSRKSRVWHHLLHIQHYNLESSSTTKNKKKILHIDYFFVLDFKVEAMNEIHGREFVTNLLHLFFWHRPWQIST